MSDRLHLDLLGAAPELGTLRMLDHAIQTTLELLAALHPERDHAPHVVEDLVVALLDTKDLAADYATHVCKEVLRAVPVAHLEDDLF